MRARTSALVVVFVAVLSSAAASQALPPAWNTTDVGAAVVPGSASFADGVFSVSAAPLNLPGTGDQFTFVYVALTGDTVFTARVMNLAAAGAGAAAGLMIRESLAAGSKQASLLLSDAGMVALKSRSTADGSLAVVSQSAAAAPIWLRLERTAATVAASRSADGIAWTSVGSTTVPMTATVDVGLAVAGGNIVFSPLGGGTSTTAKFDEVNLSPTVSLTSPSNGATYTAPATIGVTATARDVDGSIAAVDFFAGTTLIGSDTTSPYGITWSSVAAGSYTLTAMARDDKGVLTMSSARSVTVTASNQAPDVSLTSPAQGATYDAPATVTVSASASDADGTVTTVEFYAGTTLIGSDTTSPYTVTWSQVPAGRYDLTAVARDNANGITVSGGVTITVTDPQVGTTAIFDASSDYAASDYYVIEVFPAGADPASANAIAAQHIGKPPMVNGECQADIRSVIEALAPGSYIATVSAFNGFGSARSAPSPAFTR